jgi:hypothetical protein
MGLVVDAVEIVFVGVVGVVVAVEVLFVGVIFVVVVVVVVKSKFFS